MVRFCSPPMFQTWQHRSISCRAILALVRVGRGRVKLSRLRSNLRGPREARHETHGPSDFSSGADLSARRERGAGWGLNSHIRGRRHERREVVVGTASDVSNEIGLRETEGGDVGATHALWLQLLRVVLEARLHERHETCVAGRMAAAANVHHEAPSGADDSSARRQRRRRPS